MRARRTSTALSCAIALVASVLTMGAAAPTQAAGEAVLLVAGSSGPPSGDRPVRDRLLAAGMSVTVVDDDALTAGAEAGFDLVVVASSVVPSKVGSAFAASAVPLLTWEPYLLDDLGMSVGSIGEQPSQTRLSVLDSTHPIVDGVTPGGNGLLTVTTSASNHSYGTPGGDAQIVATVQSSPARAAIVAYESGAELANGDAAPARRVGMFLSYSTGSVLNSAGRLLVDNAIAWAVAGETTPVDTPPVVNAGPDQTIELPSNATTLSGTVTDDGPFGAEWTQTSGPSSTLGASTALSTTATLTGVGTYVFRLTADDGVNAAVADTVTITVVPEATGPDSVLFVAGSTGPPSGDRPIRDRLTAAGHDVTVVDDDGVTADDAVGFDLIVIATSVVPSKVASTFTDTSVPLLTWEPYLFDDLGLSAGGQAEQSGQNRLSVVNAGHSIADGVSGTVTVASSTSNFSYGTVGGDAEVVATLFGRPARAGIFTYESGAQLASGASAPARRVAMFASYSTPNRLNNAGRTLFDNAIAWALGGDSVPDDPAPTVDAGVDVTVALPASTATLNGFADDNGSLTLQWSRISGPAASIASPTSATTVVTLTDSGTYVFALEADDGTNAPVSDTVVVTLEPETFDAPPTVDAGADQEITLPTASVTLDGAASDDGPFTTEWTQTGGPASVLSNATTLAPTVTASVAGTYTYTLTAYDGVNLPQSDTVTVTVEAAASTGAKTVLFVAGSTGPPSGDRPVRDRLLAAGMDITVVDDDAVSSGDEAGFDLVVIASSVVPSKIGSTFALADVPLLTWEGHLFDDLGMTSAPNGERSNQRQLVIADATHVIADGLTGTLTVANSSSNFSYGTVGGDAAVVATHVGQPTRAGIFTYDVGAELASGEATPARRVGLFLSYSTGARLNANGIALVDNAIEWAASAPVSSVTVDVQPADTTVPDASTASFTVVASGEPPLTYQWRRNGVAIPGAIDDTLDVPDVALADTGTRFSVDIAGPFGSTSSDDATLTVVPNTAPTASLSASVAGGAAALTVGFDGTASSDDGTVLDYRWTFGDGTTATGGVVEHTFTTVGQRTVTLVVTDAGGLSDSASTIIDVSGPVATDDAVATVPGVPVNGDVFANDTDPAGSGLTITRVEPDGLNPERWNVLPIRSQEEAAQGLSGGEAEQHPRSMVRAPSNPDVIYFAQDVGQVWRSRDNGNTWEHRQSIGLNVFGSLSLAVDPVDSDRLLLVTSNMWNSLLSNHEAIYTSTDGGDTWTARRSVDVDTHSSNPRPSREHQENIAYDPTSVGLDGASTWFAAIDSDALYRSDDGGNTWTPGASLDGYDDVHNVVVHPTNGNRLYLTTAAGLLTSADGGATLAPLGDLPAGEVSWIALRSGSPSTVFAVVLGQGLYRSSNGGVNFTQVRARAARAVFLHPTDSNIMYLTSDNVNVLATNDGGATWTEGVVTPPEGLNRGDNNWKRRIQGIHTAISPDPRNTTTAVAYSRAQVWRTEDGGANFVNSSSLFTGYHWGRFPSSTAFNVDDPDQFAFFLYDVGIVRTSDGGGSFDRSRVPLSDLNDVGIPGLNMHSGGYQPGSDGQVLIATAGAGNRTGLARSADAGATWSVVHDEGAFNYVVDFHPDDPSVVYAGTARSTDAGLSFDEIDFLIDNSAEVIGFCSANADIVYASNLQSSNDQLYRSTDRGVTWAAYGNSFTWTLSPIDKQPTFAVDPTNCNRVYALRNGDLATFNGSSWTPLGLLGQARGAVASNFVQTVVVDPTEPTRLYATMMAPGQSQIWRSVDQGNTWEDITNNLPRLGAYKPTVHPVTGDLLVGSAIGTWVLPSSTGPASTLVQNSLDPRNVWIDGDVVELPSGAIVDMAVDGTFTYDPRSAFTTLDDGETATDVFTYEFNDGNGARGTGTVTMTITGTGEGPNQPPTVDAGDDQTLSLPTTTSTLSATVDDPDDTPTTNWVQTNGPTSVIASPSTATSNVTFTGGVGTYEYTMFVFDGTNPVVSDAVVITLAAVDGTARVTSGLVALYEFDEGAGAVVGDSSGSATATDLIIADIGAVSWLSGGLAITGETDIVGPASALNTSVAAADEVTIEVWLEVEDLAQNGPARIVTISESSLNRNVTLGQGVAGSTGDRFEARLRTTTTTTNGTPALASPAGSLSTGLTHVVFTRNASGLTTIFVDGAAVSAGQAGGSLSAWNLGYSLALGNEVGTSRPWRGDLHLVAVYSKALTATEIAQNQQAGPNDVTDTTVPVISGPTTTPTTSSITVSWTTDEPAVGQIDVGLTGAYELGTQPTVSGDRPTRHHTAVVAGLDVGTLHQLLVTSSDVNGNSAAPVILTATTSAG